MSIPLEKLLKQALKDYAAALRLTGKVDANTQKRIYMRGAEDFVKFLTTGSPMKRDERMSKG